jgi:hypothetical protein
MATTVVYTNDESPELVRHEGMELFRCASRARGNLCKLITTGKSQPDAFA